MILIQKVILVVAVEEISEVSVQNSAEYVVLMEVVLALVNANWVPGGLSEDCHGGVKAIDIIEHVVLCKKLVSNSPKPNVFPAKKRSKEACKLQTRVSPVSESPKGAKKGKQKYLPLY